MAIKYGDTSILKRNTEIPNLCWLTEKGKNIREKLMNE